MLVCVMTCVQDEEQLRAAVASITGYHDQFKAVAARMGQKLNLSRKELDAYEGSRPPPMSPLQGGPVEVCTVLVGHWTVAGAMVLLANAVCITLMGGHTMQPRLQLLHLAV